MVRDWRDRAVCRNLDPDMFFPAAERGPVYDAAVREAKAVCSVCPVRAECLEFAAAALSDGIAGGLTPEERRGLASGRRAAVAEVGLPAASTRAETAALGTELLGAGRGVEDIAAVCGVSVRTVQRWAAAARAA